MNLIKCPRCDLNYIREDEKYCKVCLREMKGEKQVDEMELCSVCNEEPCLPGKDVCLFCLRIVLHIYNFMHVILLAAHFAVLLFVS